MIQSEAKFLTRCEPVTRQVMCFKISGRAGIRQTFPFPKRSIKRKRVTGPKQVQNLDFIRS